MESDNSFLKDINGKPMRAPCKVRDWRIEGISFEYWILTPEDLFKNWGTLELIED